MQTTVPEGAKFDRADWDKAQHGLKFRSANRCPGCNMRVRGKAHAEGKHCITKTAERKKG